MASWECAGDDNPPLGSTPKPVFLLHIKTFPVDLVLKIPAYPEENYLLIKNFVVTLQGE